MYDIRTTPEKLHDLRKERKLKIEEVSKLTDISADTISNYEKNEYKDYSVSLLVTLAKFYGVSVDWLMGLSEIREPEKYDLIKLHLDDEILQILESGKINNRLLCEMIKHPDFPNFMADAEIYVDGIAAMHLKNVNDWIAGVRTQVVTKNNPDDFDLYMRLLASAQINDEEYFFHTIHKDIDSIIRTIRENHQFDWDSAPIETYERNSKKIQQFMNRLKYETNPVESFWRYVCEELQINYDKLSEDEHKTMKNIFKKSKLLKSIPTRKNKKRN